MSSGTKMILSFSQLELKITPFYNGLPHIIESISSIIYILFIKVTNKILESDRKSYYLS
jgi:hypothetical protein